MGRREVGWMEESYCRGGGRGRLEGWKRLGLMEGR